jgi:multidrug efflux pump subunit AcrA (membrane-fusion protein)
MRYRLLGHHTTLPNHALRVAATILVAALALTACKPKEKDARLEPPLVRVTTVMPAAQAERAFTGMISAQGTEQSRLQGGWKIIERLVDTGQVVKVGQPLMRIDQTDIDLAITTKEKAVASARAVAGQAAADEARYAELRKAGWSTQQKYEQVKAALDSANAQLAAAEAEAQVARNESGYSLLLADADGIVVETQVLTLYTTPVAYIYMSRLARLIRPSRQQPRPAVSGAIVARTQSGLGGAE